MSRPTLKEATKGGGSYFSSPSTELEFISSGCALLNCVLGGGWPLGRIANIVGDKSSGKTLLCIEAAANFARQFPKGQIYYREAESAFDRGYAQALGMPLERIDFGRKGQAFETVEDVLEDLTKLVEEHTKAKRPGLYMLDSLDALSDRAELEKPTDAGSYGTGKAKRMSELFRKLVHKIEESKLCFIIVSQVRENIGVTFGRKYTRSGGKALDFYASQCLYLAQVATHKRTIRGVERIVALQIKSKMDKNKVGLPLRDCEFPLVFGFGVDSVGASIDWLADIMRLDEIGADNPKDRTDKAKNAAAAVVKAQIEGLDDAAYFEHVALLDEVVRRVWGEIETSFLPKRRKYV